LLEKLEAGEFCKRLRTRRKRRPATDIVRTFQYSGAGLFDVVSRNADLHLRSRQATNLTDGELFLAHMHAIRSREEREIGPVIHDEERL
jgi:hypothetical protein